MFNPIVFKNNYKYIIKMQIQDVKSFFSISKNLEETEKHKILNSDLVLNSCMNNIEELLPLEFRNEINFSRIKSIKIIEEQEQKRHLDRLNSIKKKHPSFNALIEREKKLSELKLKNSLTIDFNCKSDYELNKDNILSDKKNPKEKKDKEKESLKTMKTIDNVKSYDSSINNKALTKNKNKFYGNSFNFNSINSSNKKSGKGVDSSIFINSPPIRIKYNIYDDSNIPKNKDKSKLKLKKDFEQFVINTNNYQNLSIKEKLKKLDSSKTSLINLNTKKSGEQNQNNKIKLEKTMNTIESKDTKSNKKLSLFKMKTNNNINLNLNFKKDENSNEIKNENVSLIDEKLKKFQTNVNVLKIPKRQYSMNFSKLKSQNNIENSNTLSKNNENTYKDINKYSIDTKDILLHKNNSNNFADLSVSKNTSDNNSKFNSIKSIIKQDFKNNLGEEKKKLSIINNKIRLSNIANIDNQKSRKQESFMNIVVDSKISDDNLFITSGNDFAKKMVRNEEKLKSLENYKEIDNNNEFYSNINDIGDIKDLNDNENKNNKLSISNLISLNNIQKSPKKSMLISEAKKKKIESKVFEGFKKTVGKCIKIQDIIESNHNLKKFKDEFVTPEGVNMKKELESLKLLFPDVNQGNKSFIYGDSHSKIDVRKLKRSNNKYKNKIEEIQKERIELLIKEEEESIDEADKDDLFTLNVSPEEEEKKILYKELELLRKKFSLDKDVVKKDKHSTKKIKVKEIINEMAEKNKNFLK